MAGDEIRGCLAHTRSWPMPLAAPLGLLDSVRNVVLRSCAPTPPHLPQSLGERTATEACLQQRSELEQGGRSSWALKESWCLTFECQGIDVVV